jgi:ribosomal protein S27AE
MNSEQLVKWVMEQPKNWMSKESLKNPSFYFMAQTGTNHPASFFDALNALQTQPPLPKGEWFSRETKHAYCVNCGEWVAVELSAYNNYLCGKCGYTVADADGEGGWSADGDIAEEYIWDAKVGLYCHVDNWGGDVWREDDERWNEPIEDYPASLRLPEWLLAGIVDSAEKAIFKSGFGQPTLRPSIFELAHEVDELLEFIEGEIQTLQALKTQFEEWLENAP